jgi:anti-sigma-K factor RskA
MSTNCEHLRAHYEEYVLGVLEGAEREAIEAHLRNECPRCSAGVAEARALVANLAWLAPDAIPPMRLRKRLLETVAAGLPRQRIIPAWAWIAAAALVVFSVVTAVQTQRLTKELAVLQQHLREQQSRALALDAERQQAQHMLAILSSPQTRALAMRPAAAVSRLPSLQAFWSAEGGVVLVGRQVPAPAADRTYQLWIIPRGGQPASGGIFRPEDAADGRVVYVVPVQVADAAALAITEEPGGGRPQPTSNPLWVAPIT